MKNCLNHCSRIDITEWQVVDILLCNQHNFEKKKSNHIYFDTKDMTQKYTFMVIFGIIIWGKFLKAIDNMYIKYF